MKKLLAVLAVAVTSFSATSLRADLLGTNVNGTLTFSGGSTNYFDPANGFVPTGAGNSVSPNGVVIGPGVEFSFNDTINRDVANFTGTGLTVRDACLGSFDCAGNNTFQMTFTDTSFGAVTLLTNDLGITFSTAGDVITVNFPGGAVANSNATATFRIATAQTPEPGTMGLVATGVLGAAGAIRRRFLA